MKRIILFFSFLFACLFINGSRGYAQRFQKEDTVQIKDHTAPWVYWYWMHAAVTEKGIKADLEAMKEAGIDGAYIFFISGADKNPEIVPPATQLSPHWWTLVEYAAQKADSLGIQLGMDVTDGFATAGGPWITPDLSMQKVVWSQTQVQGGEWFNDTLPQPEINENYYKDIAVYAYPSLSGTVQSTKTILPEVSTSNGKSASFLTDEENNENFVSHEPCWIQYKFEQPFVCRSIKIRVRGIAFQAYRLLIEVSNDGQHFHSIGRLKPARSGWQDFAVPEATFSIPAVKARYYRFVFDPSGTEPGSEDLDAAKWKPTFKLTGIHLFSKPQINQYEGKSGMVWRIAERTSKKEIPDSLCVSEKDLLNITKYLDDSGRLKWKVPEGNWTILRMGHTSTGQKNSTGGAAKGLECDKFNPEAVRLQFRNWFGKIYNKLGDSLAVDVLKVFHVDSWECGSQNWSPIFRKSFIKYCGYDPLKFLPAMAGVPIQSTKVSEKFLYDVRSTISKLISENFFGTLKDLAHQKNCLFSAESVAPTMVNDNMSQFSNVDIPMGEFWLRSPTHDKPNDILDAISGGHVYGKNIIGSESFTELRIEWDEYPGMLKTLLDRNFALGINRIVYHVFAENPWLNRKPGMTLNGVGLYFQRDQTWWKPGKAWVKYAQRCQNLLQKGHPVVDLAAYTGWELPRRALLPDRLLPVIPGIYGQDRVDREKKRLANKGEPLQKIPRDVTSSANIYNPINWINPLRGYHYDSFNEDVLLHDAWVEDGQIILPGGMQYRLLIIPGKRRMQPEGNIMKAEVGKQLLRLVRAGATILLTDQPERVPGLNKKKNKEIKKIGHQLFNGNFHKVKTASGSFSMKKLGKGRIIKGPYQPASFEEIGLSKDLMAKNQKGTIADDMAWNHRRTADEDIYFLSNQMDSARIISLSLRVSGKIPELYNPVTGHKREANRWSFRNGRTELAVKLPKNGSLFLLFKKKTDKKRRNIGKNWRETRELKKLKGSWQVHFKSKYDGFDDTFVFDTLKSWTLNKNDRIRYYSGTAFYSKSFHWNGIVNKEKVWLRLGQVANIASVKVNGIDCGVTWTFPYRVDITKALQKGENKIQIAVTNTWANRLMGDHRLPEDEQVTKTNAKYNLKGKELLPAGLLGPVSIIKKEN